MKQRQVVNTNSYRCDFDLFFIQYFKNRTYYIVYRYFYQGGLS